MKLNQPSAMWLYGVLFAISLSCSKSTNEDIVHQSFLTFSDNSIPADKVASNGGTFSVEVEWAFTRWSVKAGDVVDGGAFISEILPAAGGNSDQDKSATTVSFRFVNNNSYGVNRQKIILKSLSQNLSDTIVVTQAGKPVPPIGIAIDPGTIYQTISGFGGANAIWGNDNLTSGEMALAFGTGDDGLGLSILRVRLSSVKSEWSALSATIRAANAFNVKVLASPWSPPAAWKSNNNVNGGGYLLESHYADYAAYMNEFIQFMKDQGATVDVVSVQNEPDWKASYEGCEYTAEQLFNFVKNHAGTIKGAKVLAAESLNFNQNYTNDILNDAVAANHISIVGGHLYGSGLANYPLALQKGKELWMTEHLLNLDSGNKPENWTASTNPKAIWSETMEMVQEIHSAMSLNWNAYIWWYIRRYYSFLGDGEKGTVRGQILKRGYAMSHYAKFIRPGYHRVAAQPTDDPLGLMITAYSGEGKTVLVIVNPTQAEIPEIQVTSQVNFSSAVAYTTSVSKNREKAMLSPANNKVTLGLNANSITTVVLGN